MSKPRYHNIDADILNAMQTAESHGYKVLYIWQVRMWLPVVYQTACDKTLYRAMARLIASGSVKKFNGQQRGGVYTLDHNPTQVEIMQQVVASATPLKTLKRLHPYPVSRRCYYHHRARVA